MMNDFFDWQIYLRKTDFIAAPVSCFNHAILLNSFDNIAHGILVEVRSPDCTTGCTGNPCCFWIAAVIKVSGYMVLMRYEGFDSDSGSDFWVNLCGNHPIHPIGWCAENGMPLVPPKSIEEKHTDWKEYLVRRISRVKTIPPDFSTKVADACRRSILQAGLRVEALDGGTVVRPATVVQVCGGRVHLDDGGWCHESNVHPIGWASVFGLPLRSTPEYAKQSLMKTLYNRFDPCDADWKLLPPIPSRPCSFQEGMRLEAVDPQNPATICAASIHKVLRGNYIVVAIEGATDTFCCHMSSPLIFPVGFCDSHSITLTPPKGHKGEFRWSDYFKKTKSKPAPYTLFNNECVDHGFQEGMYVEAVDLMEPRLLCVSRIVEVAGRLLRLHFEGWDDQYDQWCDCKSPDIFPVGWCQMVGCRLEPPPQAENETKKNAKAGTKQRRKKRQLLFTRRKRHVETSEGITIKTEPQDVDDAEDSSMSS